MGVKKIKLEHNTEIELDLAPLLAVMVKLVPVLLLSSAFVQMMIIETELPQVVQEAIQRQDENKNEKSSITLEVSNKNGLKIIIKEKGINKIDTVPMTAGKFDWVSIHGKLKVVKKAYPEIFKVDLKPEEDVAYEDLVKLMDEARRSRDQQKFPVYDTQSGKNVETEYMFPEIVFANTFEG
ncbi:MAG: biopolymer transporter ExbD [Bdellovibrionota bacterium]